MVGFAEVLATLFLLSLIGIMAKKSSWDVNIASAFGRANPRIQFRCKPYYNGRLAGNPHKAIKKMEHDKVKIKVKTGAFSSHWYPLPIPKKFVKSFEYPETEHKEGLFIVTEFQPDVKADDPMLDFWKDLIENQDHQLAMAKKQIDMLTDNIKRGASPNYLLAQVKSLTPIIDRLKEVTERKKEELSPMIVEVPSAPKSIEKPPQPPK